MQLARVVHDLDGYPPYLPGGLRDFIATSDALAAWVVERDREIVGHVALHRNSSAAVLALASETLRQPTDRLGVIARLLVSPNSRRDGVGRSLLDIASRDALARGLWPVLDVATHYNAAISLYEHCGWVRAGQVAVELSGGVTLEEYVYLGPEAPVG